MVFPSRACNTCKKRRIKCDLTRPSCGRCVRAKHHCSWGAREDEHLPFKSENAFASGKPRRPRANNELIADQLPVALSSNLETLCVNYWVENFAFEPPDDPFDMGVEYASQVVSYRTRARPDSSFQLALSAVAHVVFGRATRMREAVHQAKHLYYKVIRLIQKDIQVVTDDRVDELLLALMLLSSIERYMPRCPEQAMSTTSQNIDTVGSRFWSSSSHQKGATGIMKLRVLQNAIICSPLDAVVRRQVTQTLILSGNAPPSWFYGYNDGEPCPAQSLDALMLRTAHLRASSLFLLERGNQRDHSGCCNVALSTVQDVLEEAFSLEEDFAAWHESLPKTWQYTEASVKSGSHAITSLAHEVPPHTYSSYRHATAWNNYRASRLIVYNIALRACRFTNAGGTEKKLYGDIYAVARDMCGGVQSILGDSSLSEEQHIPPKMASLLAWPLTVAHGIDTIPYAEKVWLSSKLQTVANVLGDDMLRSTIECGGFKF